MEYIHIDHYEHSSCRWHSPDAASFEWRYAFYFMICLQKNGVTLDDIQQHARIMVEAQGITGGQLMDKIRKEAKTVIETLASGGFTAKQSLLLWRSRRLKAVMHGGRR